MKKIGFIALLIVVAGIAFAQNSGGYNGRPIPFTGRSWYSQYLAKQNSAWDLDRQAYANSNPWAEKIEILSVEQTLVGVNVTYKCGNFNQDVVFQFKAYYNDGSSPREWSDTERIRGSRSSSTWRFTVLNCYRISYLHIRWGDNLHNERFPDSIW